MEIWKDIENFENYQVSNLGRIKSKARQCYCGVIRGFRNKKEKILTPITDKAGYQICSLYSKEKRVNVKIHRLVAQAFIPNPDNLPQINHKDENKSNNCLANLEWCNANYNINYGTRTKKVVTKSSKPIIGIDLFSGLILCFDSATQCEAETERYFKRKSIQDCCNKKRKTHKNFYWFWKG